MLKKERIKHSPNIEGNLTLPHHIAKTHIYPTNEGFQSPIIKNRIRPKSRAKYYKMVSMNKTDFSRLNTEEENIHLN
jgi:hypothetical protein